MRALSEALSPTLLSFRQKEYYDQARFHASFAWVLLDPPFEDPANGSTASFPTVPRLPEKIIPSLNGELGSLLNGSAGIFEAAEVCIRIGKDIFSWRLSG